MRPFFPAISIESKMIGLLQPLFISFNYFKIYIIALSGYFQILISFPRVVLQQC